MKRVLAMSAFPAVSGGTEVPPPLELAGLRFIDVCCAREILTAAQLHPAARVVLHHPPGVLLRIASLAWPAGDLARIGGVRRILAASRT